MKIIEYTVASLDGDYAYLKAEAAGEDVNAEGIHAGTDLAAGGFDGSQSAEGEELKCVARALLPAETTVGTRLRYEMFQYTVLSE